MSYLIEENEIVTGAVQDQALSTRNMRNMVCGENVESIRRVCGVA